MVNWFPRSRKRKRVDVPRLRPRQDDQATTKVDLHELSPDLMSFLGQAAYLQLVLFENIGRAITTAPSTDAKSGLSRVASLSLEKHHALVAEIIGNGGVPSEVMEPHTGRIDEFQRRTQGADWFESLVTCYLTAGFLDDFFAHLATGLPHGQGVANTLGGETGDQVIVDELLVAIDENPRLASRLAMWGRRLIGDTILVARQCLNLGEHNLSNEARIEPVFTELIAAHTRRMDALGLTA